MIKNHNVDNKNRKTKRLKGLTESAQLEAVHFCIVQVIDDGIISEQRHGNYLCICDASPCLENDCTIPHAEKDSA